MREEEKTATESARERKKQRDATAATLPLTSAASSRSFPRRRRRRLPSAPTPGPARRRGGTSPVVVGGDSVFGGEGEEVEFFFFTRTGSSDVCFSHLVSSPFSCAICDLPTHVAGLVGLSPLGDDQEDVGQRGSLRRLGAERRKGRRKRHRNEMLSISETHKKVFFFVQLEKTTKPLPFLPVSEAMLSSMAH